MLLDLDLAVVFVQNICHAYSWRGQVDPLFSLNLAWILYPEEGKLMVLLVQALMRLYLGISPILFLALKPARTRTEVSHRGTLHPQVHPLLQSSSLVCLALRLGPCGQEPLPASPITIAMCQVGQRGGG